MEVNPDNWLALYIVVRHTTGLINHCPNCELLRLFELLTNRRILVYIHVFIIQVLYMYMYLLLQ